MRGQKQYCRSRDAGMLDDSVFMRLNVCEVLKAKAFSDVLNFQMAGEVQAGVAGGVEPFSAAAFNERTSGVLRSPKKTDFESASVRGL